MLKYLQFILILLTISSCLFSNNTDITESDNFDCLVGEWIRTNEKEDIITHENWVKQSDTLYLGHGYTLQNTDTIFKEEIHLLKLDNRWNYMVYGVNRIPTSFRVSLKSRNSFVCKNDNNPFPKLIKYNLENNILTAEISADGKKVRFLFEQQSTDSK